MGQNIAIYNPEVIFDIAFDKMNVSLLSIGYTLLFNHHINNTNENINSLLTQHLEWAAGMGLLHFMLETLKYGGDVTIIVLSEAVKYDHRKILDYFLRRKTCTKKILKNYYCWRYVQIVLKDLKLVIILLKLFHKQYP